MREIEEPFGPEYPDALGKDVANFRKLARHGLGELSLMSRRGYGNAVLSAIREKQRLALNRAAVPIGKPNCASRTFYQTGAEILKAVRQQNAAMGTFPFNQGEANAKYEEAMEAKRLNSAPLRKAA